MKALAPDRVSLIISLYREGRTLQEVGEIFGVSREAIRQQLAKHGIGRADGGEVVRAARIAEERKQAKDALSMKKWGVPYAEYRAIPPSARIAFNKQRFNALYRGVGWDLLLGEWWRIWQVSGKWEQRGRGGYCMARKGDTGPYAVDNVYICTQSQNAKDSYIFKPAHMRKGRQRLQGQAA